jgi:hypothetical protein
MVRLTCRQASVQKPAGGWPQGREPDFMTDDEYQPVVVSRRICAPAHAIFQVLANPVRHPEFDGSESLRGAGSAAVISGVGDVFVMKMYFSHLGDYEMNNHVVEYEQDRRIGWEPEAGRGHPNAAPGSSDPARWGQRWSYQLTPDGPDATVVTEIYDCSRAPEEERVGMDNGKIWAESMAKTLERLDALCARQGDQPRPPTTRTP